MNASHNQAQKSGFYGLGSHRPGDTYEDILIEDIVSIPSALGLKIAGHSLSNINLVKKFEDRVRHAGLMLSLPLLPPEF